MYRVVNIPHHKNDVLELVASVENQTAHVKVVSKKVSPPYNLSGVCDLYIGDHMFEDDKRDALRLMVANAMITCIRAAREVGYLQAQADIRKALGM
jgi:hypothetical protein